MGVRVDERRRKVARWATSDLRVGFVGLGIAGDGP